MIRIVLDANQFVSALLKPDSNSAKIISFIRDDKVKLLLSDDIISEIGGVLLYPRIMKRHGRSADYVKSFMEKIRSVAIITKGSLQLDVIKDDPSDNKYLACAFEGRADFIVSGDSHLKELKSFKGVRVVDPAVFLEVMKGKR